MVIGDWRGPLWINYYPERLCVILYNHGVNKSDESLVILVPQKTYFQRVKEDHQRELVEDYVEEIARLHAEGGEARASDLAIRFEVSPAAVSKVIAKLRRDGFVEARPYRGIFLTSQGSELAIQVSHRHQTILQTLIALGVPEEVAHSDAEGIEHHCSEATIAAMQQFLARQTD
ncbi:manganese-binding transcriptional regulator MntR [Celerinatantimonas sp. YJH-8]|uniref:manganese-binding transcriptional regulator MntR n=1 Tax=Celerinatantimonas sp. YJH-8 TaxID=3228714 RepID=UPI0038C32691